MIFHKASILPVFPKIRKIETVKKYGINIMFVGSDWQGTDKWNKIEEELAKIGCRVEYLPHTDGISSTMLRDKLNK